MCFEPRKSTRWQIIKNAPSDLFQLKTIQPRNFSERETSVLDLFASTIQSATLETAAEAARQLDFSCPLLDPEKNEVEAYLWTIWKVMAELAGSPDVMRSILIIFVEDFLIVGTD